MYITTQNYFKSLSDTGACTSSWNALYEYISPYKLSAISTKGKIIARNTYIAPRNLHMAKPTRKSCFLGKNIATLFESYQLTRFLWVFLHATVTQFIVSLCWHSSPLGEWQLFRWHSEVSRTDLYMLKLSLFFWLLLLYYYAKVLWWNRNWILSKIREIIKIKKYNTVKLNKTRKERAINFYKV